MRQLRGSTGAALAAVSGLAYWAMVSAASGGIDLTVQAVQDGKLAAASIDASFALAAVKAA